LSTLFCLPLRLFAPRCQAVNVLLKITLKRNAAFVIPHFVTNACRIICMDGEEGITVTLLLQNARSKHSFILGVVVKSGGARIVISLSAMLIANLGMLKVTLV